ncbi:MAG: hypothetical protein ACM3U1_01920 [Chloroflexota bacterium]
MESILLILFLLTLFICATANRLRTFIKAIALQGIALFGLMFFQLGVINWVNLALLLFETIVFKSILIPYFLNFLIKRNRLTRDAEPFVSNFASLFTVTAAVVVIFFLANALQGGIMNNMYFIVSVATLFTAFYLIISRKKILTHVMAFIIMENGIVALSLAVGAEMPMLVNIGVLLDIFVTVLLLGIFVNKIGDVFKEAEVSELNRLRD